MAGKSFDRVVRESHVTMIFVNKYKLGEVHELTGAQVAKELGLEPSGHLRSILAGMVSKHILTMRAVDDCRCKNLKGNSGQKYWYDLHPDRIKEIEAEAREVAVKIKGVIAGQLRMF